jgi:DNA-binding FadR family transcriptional regulator
MSTLERKISSDIRNGVLAPGSQLPTEREFAESFGVSRAAVRRSLAHLENEGYVVREVGRGTFVADSPSGLEGGGKLDLSDMSPSEVTNARLYFEPYITSLAAVSATRENLGNLEKLIKSSEAAESVQEFDYYDGAFHLAIAEATQNSFLQLICNNVQQVRNRAEWGRLKYVSVTPERRLIYEADHRKIFEAIRTRDGKSARAEAMNHLRNVINFLF